MLFLFGLTRKKEATRPPTADERLDDLVLVQAARTDPAAFTFLYERYFERIYNYCAVRLRSREAAEDATSETFLKALSGLSGYREGLFAAWLFQIAHNTVINSQRRRKPAALFEAESIADPGPTLEELAVSRAEQSELQAALAKLPDEQRTVLELQCAGWSGQQVAEAMAKSPTAVRMLRHRAVEKLRQLVLEQETRP